jgi:hypothetical protein
MWNRIPPGIKLLGALVVLFGVWQYLQPAPTPTYCGKGNAKGAAAWERCMAGDWIEVDDPRLFLLVCDTHANKLSFGGAILCQYRGGAAAVKER